MIVTITTADRMHNGETLPPCTQSSQAQPHKPDCSVLAGCHVLLCVLGSSLTSSCVGDLCLFCFFVCSVCQGKLADSDSSSSDVGIFAGIGAAAALLLVVAAVAVWRHRKRSKSLTIPREVVAAIGKPGSSNAVENSIAAECKSSLDTTSGSVPSSTDRNSSLKGFGEMGMSCSLEDHIPMPRFTDPLLPLGMHGALNPSERPCGYDALPRATIEEEGMYRQPGSFATDPRYAVPKANGQTRSNCYETAAYTTVPPQAYEHSRSMSLNATRGSSLAASDLDDLTPPELPEFSWPGQTGISHLNPSGISTMSRRRGASTYDDVLDLRRPQGAGPPPFSSSDPSSIEHCGTTTPVLLPDRQQTETADDMEYSDEESNNSRKRVSFYSPPFHLPMLLST